MFADQFPHLLLVAFTQKLSNHLLGDVAADVLVVVALATHLLLLYLLEHVQPATTTHHPCPHSRPCSLGLGLLRPTQDDIGCETEDGVPY